MLARCLLFLFAAALVRADLPDLSSVPADLTTPVVEDAAAAAGKRVRQTTQGWESSAVHHALYLPTDWKPDVRYPVIVEYAGNGGFKNKYGDVSEGNVEGSHLGYGLSGGHKFIWVCMPYVEIKDGQKQNATLWWGDVGETVRYCLATVRAVCANYGGDQKAIFLAGFSRGAIAGNFIGLHDDEISALWCGFICHSHYDGVREGWPYAGADRAAALIRLRRLAGRPQWISHEGSVQATEEYLQQTGVKGDFTFVALPFRNHSDQWTLRDLPERKQARAWMERVLAAIGAEKK